MNDHSITVWKIMQQLALEKTWNQNYANDIFNNPEQIIYDAANNEYLYIKGDDLLRLGEDGEFISLYPGAQSGKVTSVIENGGTIWP